MLVEGRRKWRGWMMERWVVTHTGCDKGTQGPLGGGEKALRICPPGLCLPGLGLPPRDPGVWNMSRERPLLSRAGGQGQR